MLHVPGVVPEEIVLQFLDPVVHHLEDVEVTVHDVVKQAVEQVGRPELGHVGVDVPAPDHLVDVELGALLTVTSAFLVTKIETSTKWIPSSVSFAA